jgi:glycosyltransferase involved in cell wall biosynthesis
VSTGISTYLSENGYRNFNISIIPNFSGVFPLVDSNVSEFYFLGRLVPEKGIVFLTDFWKMHPQLPKLHVIGGGPLLGEIKKSAKNSENIEVYGPLFANELEAVIANCKALIAPNIWQEPFGRVMVEAWARGQIVLTTDPTNFLGQSQFSSFITPFRLSHESTLTAILHTIENSLPIARSEAVAFWAENFAEAAVSKKWNNLFEKMIEKQ